MTHTVLIVDDDYDLRDTLADILQDEGFAVATADDGLAALEYLRTQPRPCMILLDYMMPRCDGAQFRAEQLRDQALATIPTVLLTADRQAEQRLAELQLERFLAKPVSRETLCAAVRGCCAG